MLLRDANDPLLAPLLEARDEASRASALDALATRALRLADAVLRRHAGGSWSHDDLADWRGTVMMRLMRRLEEIPRAPDAAIVRFDDFVARLAYNVHNDALRARFPQRARLKNRVRYVLSRSTQLATWHSAAGLAAGLAADRDREPVPLPRIETLPRGELEPALAALFDQAGAPLLLDDVVGAIAQQWGIVDSEPLPYDEAIGADGIVAWDEGEQREHLRALWQEIASLRGNQRLALLLNLRDGGAGTAKASSSAIELFVLTGAATIEELAMALEMTPPELAELWNALPLDDETIAARLGVNRQQVVNLRRAARERLMRRMS